MCLSSLFYELWPFENCKMYSNVLKNSLLKWPELPGKCIDQLDIWLTDASVNSVKWWKKLNSKLYFKLSTQNLKNMFFLDPKSKYERIFEFETVSILLI